MGQSAFPFVLRAGGSREAVWMGQVGLRAGRSLVFFPKLRRVHLILQTC